MPKFLDPKQSSKLSISTTTLGSFYENEYPFSAPAGLNLPLSLISPHDFIPEIPNWGPLDIAFEKSFFFPIDFAPQTIATKIENPPQIIENMSCFKSPTPIFPQQTSSLFFSHPSLQLLHEPINKPTSNATSTATATCDYVIPSPVGLPGKQNFKYPFKYFLKEFKKRNGDFMKYKKVEYIWQKVLSVQEKRAWIALCKNPDPEYLI